MTEADLLRTWIGRSVRVVIDRPLGSQHPQHGFTYPVNYGYVPGVPAPDGDDLDAYILGIDHPLHEFVGVCIAVIHRLNDMDDKLVLAMEGQNFSDEEILTLTAFQEQWFHGILLRNSSTISANSVKE
uniref:inorganic diphosphatase n=1 Tax=Anaerolinea thermolimosa TaxID=229919 RepID=A0A7C4PIS5_9CHLR